MLFLMWMVCVVVWGRAPSLTEQKATDEQAAKTHSLSRCSPNRQMARRWDDAAVMSKPCVPTAENMKIRYRAFQEPDCHCILGAGTALGI
jgi:hypothetical protein